MSWNHLVFMLISKPSWRISKQAQRTNKRKKSRSNTLVLPFFSQLNNIPHDLLDCLPDCANRRVFNRGRDGRGSTNDGDTYTYSASLLPLIARHRACWPFECAFVLQTELARFYSIQTATKSPISSLRNHWIVWLVQVTHSSHDLIFLRYISH